MVIYFGSTRKRMPTVGSKENGVQWVANPPSSSSHFSMGLSSVQFSHSVVSDSLRPHESQHSRPPCPSPTPGVHTNSCPSSRWYDPAISSSVVPFSSCPQSLPASESFPMSQLFAWGGQSIGVSPLAWVLPMNTQDWSLPHVHTTASQLWPQSTVSSLGTVNLLTRTCICYTILCYIILYY